MAHPLKSVALKHSKRKGITAGTAGLSLSWAVGGGLRYSPPVCSGAVLFSPIYLDTRKDYIKSTISAAFSRI